MAKENNDEFAKDFYNRTYKFTITLPFILNAGSAISLGSFFNNGIEKVDWQIKTALLLYIFGTVIGIITLIHEYFVAYFYLKRASKFKAKPLKNNISQIAFLQILIGIFSFFSWILGTYFIVNLIFPYYLVTLGIFLFVLISTLILIKWTKGKIDE
ncbi:TPA: hypothetical protein GJ770_04260 [Legionella pneumophila]|nr:hypothetical protein [Legionella pneumophila]